MKFDKKDLVKYPTKCGVYLMKDEAGRVIYVGKAINLKNRIKQYFEPGRDSRATVKFLTEQVATIDTIIVSNNKEALILENTLIKKHLPKYNILLKDDKTYASIMLTTDKWPRLKIVRFNKRPKDKNLYFGPYTNARAAKDTLELLQSLFPLRQCSDLEFLNRTRPCILYDIKKCIAPCVNKCSHEEYKAYVEQAINFLKGSDSTIVKKLKDQMKKASDNLEYEKANSILHILKQIEHVTEAQFVDILDQKDLQCIGFYRDDFSIVILKLIFHEGKLIGSEHFSFSNIVSSDEEILDSFLFQHFKYKDIPSEILIPFPIANIHNIEEILSENAKKKINILYPQKGKKKELIELANKNAKAQFKREEDLRSLYEKQLLSLQETLQLNHYPKVIQCLDTSNIASSDNVAALITFLDGQKDKKHTKLFKIKTEKKGDVAAMEEVLYRNFSKEKDFCNLLVLDGGKAQLNIALKVFDELNIANIDIISLTKEGARHDKGLTKEKVYIPHLKDPIIIDPTSPLLFLLQKIRDEAHRAAISFHKKRRAERTFKSELTEIEGIGPKKKKVLLKHFGSIKNIKNASKKELQKVKELNLKDINNILNL